MASSGTSVPPSPTHIPTLRIINQLLNLGESMARRERRPPEDSQKKTRNGEDRAVSVALFGLDLPVTSTDGLHDSFSVT